MIARSLWGCVMLTYDKLQEYKDFANGLEERANRSSDRLAASIILKLLGEVMRLRHEVNGACEVMRIVAVAADAPPEVLEKVKARYPEEDA